MCTTLLPGYFFLRKLRRQEDLPSFLDGIRDAHMGPWPSGQTASTHPSPGTPSSVLDEPPSGFVIIHSSVYAWKHLQARCSLESPLQHLPHRKDLTVGTCYEFGQEEVRRMHWCSLSSWGTGSSQLELSMSEVY